jgi:hypothetical protein
MASIRLRRHTHRALLVASVAIISISLAVLAATSDEPSKPGPIAREGALVAAPNLPSDETPPAAPLTGSVPARAPIPAGVLCPTDWSYFDNPVMHYGLCVPPGWGFSDFTSPVPLDRVPAVQLENLHLLGNAFPWHPGALPFDAIMTGVLDVELDILPASIRSTGECEPASKQLVGALTLLTCEQRYDNAGLPSAAGLLRALKAIVPLQSPPADGSSDLAGARLLVIARSRASASIGEVTTLWQIVRSIHPY